MQAILSLTVVIFVIDLHAGRSRICADRPSGDRIMTDAGTPISSTDAGQGRAFGHCPHIDAMDELGCAFPAEPYLNGSPSAFLVLLVLISFVRRFHPRPCQPELPYGDFSQPPELTLNGLFGTDAHRPKHFVPGPVRREGVADDRSRRHVHIGFSRHAARHAGRLLPWHLERMVDLYANTMCALPPILVVLAFVTATGNSVMTIMLHPWHPGRRHLCARGQGGRHLSNDRDYVLAARAMGATDARILVKRDIAEPGPRADRHNADPDGRTDHHRRLVEFPRLWYSCACAELGRYDRQLDRFAESVPDPDLRADPCHRPDRLFAEHRRRLSRPTPQQPRAGAIR